MPSKAEKLTAVAQEAVRLFKRLGDYYDADDAVKWVWSPQPLLDDAVPADLITQGRAKELHDLWDRLDAGAYV